MDSVFFTAVANALSARLVAFACAILLRFRCRAFFEAFMAFLRASDPSENPGLVVH